MAGLRGLSGNDEREMKNYVAMLWVLVFAAVAFCGGVLLITGGYLIHASEAADHCETRMNNYQSAICEAHDCVFAPGTPTFNFYIERDIPFRGSFDSALLSDLNESWPLLDKCGSFSCNISIVKRDP